MYARLWTWPIKINVMKTEITLIMAVSATKITTMEIGNHEQSPQWHPAYEVLIDGYKYQNKIKTTTTFIPKVTRLARTELSSMAATLEVVVLFCLAALRTWRVAPWFSMSPIYSPI